jgi:hypothetical protein
VETGNDCQAAEDHKPPVGCVCTAWLNINQPGCFIGCTRTFNKLFDKGKPGKSRRRKATGLPLETAMAAEPPKTTLSLFR